MMEGQNGARANQESILLVDDTPDNLRLLSQILAARHYQVRAVTSGPRALDSVQRFPPDLILLDIKMPGMDGFEVCQALKGKAETADIPIIFISALGDIEDKVRAFSLGGVDYITKPFQYEEVVARAETHLALRRLQQQLQRANRKMSNELALAGQVQASFLPNHMPAIPGWQLDVSFLPARETSGDFFDTFDLPDGRLGLLVADVVDKGVCAALFMSLSYALFRSYAFQHPGDPREVLEAVNRHILHATHTDQFATAFYGILDPVSGRLEYCNAGHCPPLLLDGQGRAGACWLGNTGLPVGMMDDRSWDTAEVCLQPGDVLLLYTDGVIEAENSGEAFYGRERLAAAGRSRLGHSAMAIREGLMADLRRFVAGHPQVDDIVLMVVRREPGP